MDLAAEIEELVERARSEESRTKEPWSVAADLLLKAWQAERKRAEAAEALLQANDGQYVLLLREARALVEGGKR